MKIINLVNGAMQIVLSAAPQNYSVNEFNKIKDEIIRIFNQKIGINSQIEDKLNSIKYSSNKNDDIMALTLQVKYELEDRFQDIYFEQNDIRISEEQRKNVNVLIQQITIMPTSNLGQKIQYILNYLGDEWIGNKQNYTYEELNKSLARTKYVIARENRHKFDAYIERIYKVFSGFYVDEFSSGDIDWYLNSTDELNNNQIKNIYLSKVILPKFELLHENKQLKIDEQTKATILSKIDLDNINSLQVAINEFAKIYHNEFIDYDNTRNYTFNEVWKTNIPFVYLNNNSNDSFLSNDLLNKIKNMYINEYNSFSNSPIDISKIEHWNEPFDQNNIKKTESEKRIMFNITKPLIEHFKNDVLTKIRNKYSLTNEEMTEFYSMYSLPEGDKIDRENLILVYDINKASQIKTHTTFPIVSILNFKKITQNIFNTIGNKYINKQNYDHDSLNWYQYTIDDLLDNESIDNEDKNKNSNTDNYINSQNTNTQNNQESDNQNSQNNNGDSDKKNIDNDSSTIKNDESSDSTGPIAPDDNNNSSQDNTEDSTGENTQDNHNPDFSEAGNSTDNSTQADNKDDANSNSGNDDNSTYSDINDDTNSNSTNIDNSTDVSIQNGINNHESNNSDENQKNVNNINSKNKIASNSKIYIVIGVISFLIISFTTGLLTFFKYKKKK
ncbi:MSCRAMM family adhesin SdrC [Mycoplasma sp. HS2188]|uniref:MSCRAMM family adhesin SdrC n=1 Tax=Mycoplasma sp. HS2188 TaxID=2976765 RepID=UPI0021AA6BA5|nr:MSCRAMM family adhesin SdrC [Mycoplasma sp. HS2188]MCT4469477.1 MSCRAMM family adhesin SdrC [Mycoplasma sp. HS2188]